jgi:hypothetical protein
MDAMTDIVERLRAFFDAGLPVEEFGVVLEAAVEIERLTTAVNMLLDGTALRDKEIERLKALTGREADPT